MSLYGDDRLLRDPSQVAKNDEISWATALCFWKTKVSVSDGVQRGEFGVSTKAINGAIECPGRADVARKRFEIYKKCLARFRVDEQPNESGCY